MKLSKNAQNSALLIAEKIITIGLAFLVSVLLARIGGPTLFGDYSYMLSFAAIFAPLCVMGLNNIVTKYVVKYPNNSHFYVKSALIVRFAGSILAIILGSASLILFNQNSTLDWPIFSLILFQSFNILLVYEYYFLAKQNVLGPLKIRLAITLFTNATKLLLIIQTANINWLITVVCAEYLMIGLSYHLLYRNQGSQHIVKRKITHHGIKVLLGKGKWLLLSGIAAVIYMKIDQVMLANMVNSEEVAFYAAAAKLSEFWYVFPVLIANAYNPTLIKLRKLGLDSFNQKLRQFLSSLVFIAILLSLVTYLIAKPLITIIYGEAYLQSADILSIHIFATIFIFQRALLSKWLIIHNLLKYSLITHGIGALINVSLNLMLIPNFGGVGAAWATVFSYAVASYFSLFISTHTRPFAKLMTKAMIISPLVPLHIVKRQTAHYD
ncbi:flippase [Colwellia sp. MEBiC06753]